MDTFRRSTLIAAIVLTVIVIVAAAFLQGPERRMEHVAPIAGLMLVAIWGSWFGVNAVYRGVFAQGQTDERGKDTDFI